MDPKFLEALSPIVVALIAGLFSLPLLGLVGIFQRKRLEKITNSAESLKLFENYVTDFKANFVLPDLKENYFYIQTGIRTNEKSISKYIDFKNKLGRNYTWESIKSVQSHLDINSCEIKIKLASIQLIFHYFKLITSLLLITSAPLIYLYFDNKYVLPQRMKLFTSAVFIYQLFFATFLAYSVKSTAIAIGMRRLLEK